MPLAVKKDEPSYPLDIGILGPYAVVLKTNPLANTIQQLWRLIHSQGLAIYLGGLILGHADDLK
jgi:hypothetical protein